jgi:hypothetical protein
LWSFLSSLEYPTWYMAWDDRRPVIQTRRDFVVESTIVALRPTRLRGIRLKLQDTFAFTQPTSVVMPVGNVGSNGPYTDVVAKRDRFPDFHGKNQHMDLLPTPRVRWDVHQWTTGKGSPSSVLLRKVVEDRRPDGPLVPNRTGGLIQSGSGGE